MNIKHIKKVFFALLLATSFAAISPVVAKNNAIDADTIIIKSSTKFKDNRPNRPVFENSFKTDFDAFMFKMTSLKTGISTDKKVSTTKSQSVKNLSSVSLDVQKPIDNVKVYPNPVSNQLNLSYSLKREGMVTIKILDVLGNDVFTLLNQKLPAGVQTNKFMIESKLNTGFYFVRIISGSDSIVKRISVL
ncbi:MAG TPA: T9SS type A sorting domain-containing protein [Pelobium sp.]|nr:T9SS type A sorting domain-containing protein [Pelobium sp.]